jgi:hypothetical protein
LLTVRKAQLDAMAASADREFVQRLQRLLQRHGDSLRPGAAAAAAAKLPALLLRARQLGFASRREQAAFAVAVLAAGDEQRLAGTDTFQLALFDVTASGRQRARWLMQARQQRDGAGAHG